MKNRRHEREVQYNIKNKDMAMTNFTNEILSKTTQIFEYRNLPEELADKATLLETFLQQNGNVFFHKVNDTLYFFTGGTGGEPDAYYRPTLYTIANPALKYSTQAVIGTDGVLMRNDIFSEGLMPLITKYGTMLIEMNISIINAIVNTRDYNAFSAQDDKTKASVELYQQKIIDGDYAVIGESAMLEGLKRHPAPPLAGTMTELKELRQYIKAQLYSDLGMKTAHNMKSQYVSDAENIINDDTLLPLIQDMLRCRKQAVEELNKMFDLNVEVELAGTWKLQQEKVDMELEMITSGDIEEIEDVEELPTEEDITPEEPETEQEPEETEEPQQEDEPDIDIDIVINTSDDRDHMEVLDDELAKLDKEDTDDEEVKPSN